MMGKPAESTMPIHQQAVVGDGSGRVFGVGFDPEDMDGEKQPAPCSAPCSL